MKIHKNARLMPDGRELLVLPENCRSSRPLLLVECVDVRRHFSRALGGQTLKTCGNGGGYDLSPGIPSRNG